jgi:hypothetical protein
MAPSARGQPPPHKAGNEVSPSHGIGVTDGPSFPPDDPHPENSEHTVDNSRIDKDFFMFHSFMPSIRHWPLEDEYA